MWSLQRRFRNSSESKMDDQNIWKINNLSLRRFVWNYLPVPKLGWFWSQNFIIFQRLYSLKENIIFLFFYASEVLFSLNLADSDRFEAMILHILQYNFLISQIRHRFGLYDEITCTDGKKTRHCNWIRFLKVKESYGPQVSIIDCLFLQFVIGFLFDSLFRAISGQYCLYKNKWRRSGVWSS